MTWSLVVIRTDPFHRQNSSSSALLPPENNFEIYENLNRDDNCPVKATRKRLTSRQQFMRRNIDRGSIGVGSDEEPLEEFSFRQLSNCSDHQFQHKRHSIVAESVVSCESEVSTTSTFICSNQSEVSHVPATLPPASQPEPSGGAGGVAAGAPSDRAKEPAMTRSTNESDEDNIVQQSKHQRRHAINITSNPGYQVSGHAAP